jgi:hypothetical protein
LPAAAALLTGVFLKGDAHHFGDGLSVVIREHSICLNQLG